MIVLKRSTIEEMLKGGSTCSGTPKHREVLERSMGECALTAAHEMLKGAADAWSEDVPEHVKDISRVLESMREELDAVNQYALRIVRTKDTDLAEILAHNKKEEIEHFVMLIEYARNAYPEFDEVMREILFGGENGEPKLTRAMLRMRGIVADRAAEKGFDRDDNTPECIKCADAMQGVHP